MWKTESLLHQVSVVTYWLYYRYKMLFKQYFPLYINCICMLLFL